MKANANENNENGVTTAHNENNGVMADSNGVMAWRNVYNGMA
jgi:hypothetical protein